MTIDFLIIGQGLAGSLLAWELMQRNCQVIVIDSGKENASQIAAGLINPITGLRFVKSAHVDSLLPAAKRFYSRLSGYFQQSFYIEKPMLRIFCSEKEVKNCMGRFDDPAYRSYLGDLIPPERPIANLVTPFGFLEQKQTGYLLTRPLLRCLKDFFISANSYRLADLNYGDIQLKPSLRWQDIYARQIIFCEGYRAIQNPWFSWLPFQAVKGEILTLEHEAGLPDKILNYGNWLLPLNSHQIRTGATFDRENLDTEPTESGKDQLLTSLGQMSADLRHAKLINHEANIRPSTQDRYPFIGTHPQHRQVAIFNGFGAKGSVQIPWHSQRLADALLHGALLPDSCNINRHYATHFPG
ncbi:FAD dependent oxidoreductase [Candidatus Methylobacter favarea]|uniref:FAD dependent oxidoreductase n=1 Tax=Candidatus Methylobacter favarea TaxID=2707345 RepID=A0A8S0XSC2_9GAMM|nr:FAD-binding oxidoreductase [Candidatus Methylobacter favarea]CAA9890652.1 FAD dependent oxidoreductase [Candidatus Methylobacter favarea]